MYNIFVIFQYDFMLNDILTFLTRLMFTERKKFYIFQKRETSLCSSVLPVNEHDDGITKVILTVG